MLSLRRPIASSEGQQLVLCIPPSSLRGFIKFVVEKRLFSKTPVKPLYISLPQSEYDTERQATTRLVTFNQPFMSKLEVLLNHEYIILT